jgi:RIO kinase 2
MIDEALRVFKELDSKDFRILTGIEIGMKHFEWVPMDELNKYIRLPFEKLEYRLKKLVRNKLVVRTTQPYEGFQIYFEGYDALALNAFVKRKSIIAIGDEVGVGKESVIYEAILPPELAIGEPVPVVIKFHREGRTSFKQIKRVREHLGDREHFSWIYAARLAAQREYGIMATLYPKVSIPKPFDHNRHAIVMELAKGSLLSKTKLLDPEWYLDEILKQVKITYSLGVIHADLSEYNIFASEDGIQLIDWPQYVTPEHPQADEILERDVSNILTHFFRKYGIKRELDETIREIKSQTCKSAGDIREGAQSRTEKGTIEKWGLEEALEEEGFEGDIFQDEDFEVEKFEAENFEAEEFEAEEFETKKIEAEETEAEDLKAQDFKKAASKKETLDKE